jgi:CDP-4-dehydro-6-deoxyglucose reductase
MSFTVSLLPGAHTFEASPDESLLQAALAAELLVPYGCRDGACGACKAQLVEGKVDHGHSPERTLPAEDRTKGLVLMCCAQARSELVLQCREVRSAHDIPIRKLPCRVQSLEKVAPDVMVLTVKLPPGEVFQFRAGQYIDFLLADGGRRSFSIANAPIGGDTLELHVREVPGGHFTGRVFSTLKPRDILRLEGPLGSFFLREAAVEGGDKPIILLAGGTGFAPMKAIIEHLLNQPVRRSVALYWGARTREGLYLHALAERWAHELPDFRYVPVLSDQSPAGWSGHKGLVHRAVMTDWPDLSAHQVYACGAPAMIEAARADFTQGCGLPDTAFFADAFTFASDIKP